MNSKEESTMLSECREWDKIFNGGTARYLAADMILKISQTARTFVKAISNERVDPSVTRFS